MKPAADFAAAFRNLCACELDSIAYPSVKASQSAALREYAGAVDRWLRSAPLKDELEKGPAKGSPSVFGALATEFWKLIASHPSLDSLEAQVLGSSSSVKALASLLTHHDREPGRALAYALQGAFGCKQKEGRDRACTEKLASLILDWWAEDLCTGRWGIDDVYALAPADDDIDIDSSAYTGSSPVATAAMYGQADLMEEIARRGGDVNGSFSGSISSSPLYHAYAHEQTAAFLRLLELGVDLVTPYKSEGLPLATALQLRGASVAGGRLLKCHLRMLGAMVRTRPEAATLLAATIAEGGRAANTVAAF